MSQSVSLTNQQAVDLMNQVVQLSIGSLQKQGGIDLVPNSAETLAALQKLGGSFLPELKEPQTSTSSMSVHLGTLTLNGLSLESMMDAVGMEERNTETKAGKSTMEARADERQKVNEERVKQVEEELKKLSSQGILGGFLKAFKYIGMALGAIASVAMIVAGGVGLAAGGSGAALIAVGLASLYMVTDSIVQEATDGKVGIGLGSAAAAISKAAGASEDVAQWIKMGVDLAATIALAIVSFGTASGTAATNGLTAGSQGLQNLQKVASVTSKVTTVAQSVNTVAQSSVGMANAFNEKDITNLQAEQKKLQAILERISQANDLDIEHLKAMIEGSEETLRTVSDIVQESVDTQLAIMTGAPAMA